MTEAILNVTAIGVVFAVIWLFGLVLGIKPPKDRSPYIDKSIDSLADLMSDLLKHQNEKDKEK